MKVVVALRAWLRQRGSMNKYQCWFCGDDIDRTDCGAVMIMVENLWDWDAGVQAEDRPFQSVYAHSGCAKRKMKGATMDLEPEVFDRHN